MKFKEKVVVLLLVLYLISVFLQVYVIFTVTGMATAQQGTVSLQILSPFVFVIDGQVNPDGQSVDLNWTNVSNALSYNVYYSQNISAIMTLDLNSVPSDVNNFSNITQNNYTDTAAPQSQKRYYTVSYVSGASEVLTNDTPVGKFTYYYDVPNSSVYGPLASNRINLYLDVNYTAESFLQEISGSLNPTISKLDKSNASGEFLTTHVRGLNDGNNFQMVISQGYLVTVNDYFNHTIAGDVYLPPYTLRYQVPNSSVYGPLASNWYGIYDFKKNYTAESFLQEIPGSLNPTVSRLDKSDASGEFLTTHVRGLNDGNDFNILIGTSYIITVDDYYNHTLCTTNCFS